jgi:Glutaminase
MAYKDYFDLIACGQPSSSPRAATMAEAKNLFAQFKAMHATLRLDYNDNGCAERSTLIEQAIKHRGFKHGSAHCDFNSGQWTQHNAAYMIVTTDHGEQRMLIDPESFNNVISEGDWKEHWNDRGADPRSHIFLDNFVITTPAETLLNKLHTWPQPVPVAA